MLTMETRATTGAEDAMVLPLPPVVDTPAVVLLGLLGGGCRPLVLDAAELREVQPTAAPLLEALLRATREAGFPARIVGATPALRRALAGSHLAAWLADAPEADEHIFVCPDRDALGFQPSLR